MVTSTDVRVIPLRDVLRAVMEEYAIRASELSAKSGVPESSISKFLSGSSDLRTTDVDAIRTALPDEARMHLLQLLGHCGSVPVDENARLLLVLSGIREYAQMCSTAQFQEVLGAIIEGRAKALEHA
ncbi:MAG: hypothetical protein DCF21_14685 [Leptolyngbya sp.]|nr:MAG: hypothetical protein DCF21_14685 [Leptolyngbya sp.]